MADYGNRVNGTKKGAGYFGVLKRPDGNVSTELSVGVDFGDGEEEIPLLVPTLTKTDIERLLKGEKPSKAMIDIAVEFARARKKEGLPAFALPAEEGKYKIPAE
jgi:hypothetical protein